MAEEKKGKKDTIKLSKNAQKALELVGDMSILELSQLVKAMEDTFGITPISATAIPAAGSVDAAGNGKSTEEEKSSYDVVLQSAGGQKIAVIKAVRSINQNLGLKEAKDLVEGAPKTVAENVPVEEAKEAKKALEEAGATVELK